MTHPVARREHILIVEKNGVGHRLYYVRLLADGARNRGHAVTIALAEGQQNSSEIAVHLSALDEDVRIISVSDFSPEAIARLANRLDVTTTVVPDGDLFGIAIGREGAWHSSSDLSVLVMRESAQPSRVWVVQKVKTAIRLHYLRKAQRLPRVRVTVLKGATWSGESDWPVAVDPVTLTGSAADVAILRQRWGLADERYWFAIIGAISARKNIATVAEALQACSPGSVGLLVAGKWDESALSGSSRSALDALRARGVAVIVRDYLLSDLEVDTAVHGVDCIVLAHSNEGPSGLLGKAAAAGTRIIAAGAVSLRHDVVDLADAALWVPLDVTSLSAACEAAQALARPTPCRRAEHDSFVEALL